MAQKRKIVVAEDHKILREGLKSLLGTVEDLEIVGEGYKNKEISDYLCISVKTVENHLTRLYRSLGVYSRSEALSYLMRHPEILAATGQDSDAKVAEPGAGKSLSVLLVDDNPRSATVRALTNCQLFYISKDQFQGFLAASKDLKLRFYESCIHTIVTRLRELDDNYVISQYQLWKAAFKKEAA